jgi:glutathione synthase/RimK-type ligase-like ATP-grasp enzyme
VSIAKKAGLAVVGIDIITKDLSRPLKESWWAIIELNAAPGFWGDREFTSVNTAKKLLEYIF